MVSAKLSQDPHKVRQAKEKNLETAIGREVRELRRQRDMTVADKRKELLAESSFLFIPILNVDGHERRSEFNRINQRGPVEMGWRTNARNQNLNRDFTKLDTEGVRENEKD